MYLWDGRKREMRKEVCLRKKGNSKKEFNKQKKKKNKAKKKINKINKTNKIIIKNKPQLTPAT